MGESERDMVKTYEEVAEEIYDDLQHNRITNSREYEERLEKESGGAVINEILHNRWSFGFCDKCGEVIFYDEGGWYDLCGDLLDCEREKIEQRLPANTEIQDVCATCFNKLVAEEWESQ